MTKLDIFLLHIPLIGLMYMFTLMGSGGKTPVPTYEQTKVPMMIQILSVIAVFIITIYSVNN